jgi:hypothetical protein
MSKQAGLRLSLNHRAGLTFLVSVGLILFVSVLGVRAWINKKTAVFTTTTSPQNTYTINLKGAKGRPFLIPYWVSADVYKRGEPYVADVLLHEAWDALDLSFELGYPEIRWPANNVVEFYRPENFKDGNDLIIVQNRSGKHATGLFINAVSKFLVVDLKPGGSLSLKTPKPRGDWHWIGLEGVLVDGTKISRHHASGRRRNKEDCTTLISILESSAEIELRTAGCQ